MNKIFSFLILGLIVCSCNKDDSDDSDTGATRTVFVYMAGENNLSTYLDTDIKEIMEGSKTLSDRENLIVYVDKASKTELPYMARIKDGEITDKYELTADPSTADPKVLELMLSQAKESYPAKSYGLVLWGHANGWLIMNDSIRYEAASRSYGGDTGNNTSGSSGSQWMNIPSMAKAIAKAMNGTQLDYIFADCCNLGGSIEVAYELKDVTKYLIGSPAEIPNKGANYNSIMKGLFSTSDSFYQEICDNYFNSNSNNLSSDLPLVTIKTSELKNLAAATSDIMNSIADKISPSGQLDTERVVYYGYIDNFSTQDCYKYAYDMQFLLKRNATDDAFNTWYSYFDKAVPYSVASNYWDTAYNKIYLDQDNFDGIDDCGVVSMFFPMTMYDNWDKGAHTSYPNWNQAIKKMQWYYAVGWAQYGW